MWTVPNTESLIVDHEGRQLGVDEVGELLVRGPQVMAGYLNNPDATADTVDADGWLRTGDLARIDADGHLFIVGRVKELIKYNGFQVAPAELEALLLEHAEVADVGRHRCPRRPSRRAADGRASSSAAAET